MILREGEGEGEGERERDDVISFISSLQPVSESVLIGCIDKVYR